jgi:membrane protease YdiL (CAAX protease family)
MMLESLSRADRTVALTLLFELGLGGAALVIGLAVGFSPAIGLEGTPRAQLVGMGWGVVGTLPLLAALVVLDWIPWRAIEGVRDVASQMLLQMFGGARAWQLALVALAAGTGEELLFRGLIQTGLANLVGPPYGWWGGLVAAAVIFGCCHWLSGTYAVLAALAGLYFGGLLLLTGSLWTPIVAHALYDYVAMIYLIRSQPRVE